MGGGARNRKIHDWARKLNRTAGSPIRDWEDTLAGEEDAERERRQDEEERDEIDRAEQEFLQEIEAEKLTARLKRQLDDLLDRWGKLPEIAGRDRKALQSEIDAGSDRLDERNLEEAEYALEKAAGLMPEEERESKRIVQACAELAANIDHKFFIMIKERALLDEEGKALMDWRGKKVAALKDSDLGVLQTVHDEITGAFDTWWNDHPTLKQRFSRQRSDKTKGKAAAMMCVRSGMTVDSFDNVPDRTAFRAFTGTPVTTYKILGIKECRAHAWRRHTPEGVWKLQAIETAHVSDVALFRDAGELDAALNAVASETDAKNWESRSGGGVQCRVGRAMAYGTVVGTDEIYLETCFPLGVNIPKEQVRSALGEADYSDFLHRLGL